MRRTLQSSADGAESSVEADRRDGRPGLWTAAALATSAPLLILLCLTLWRTPFPISEAVALFEDMETQPIATFLSSQNHYFRPLFYLAVRAVWRNGGDLETRLAWIRLLVIVPAMLLVVLFIGHLRPRTAIEFGAAGLAVAVLMGTPGFQDTLEIGFAKTVGILAALLAWILVNQERRAWHAPLIVACTLVAIGFREQGLALVPLVIAAWWTRAPGTSRGLALTLAAVAVAYVGFRLSGRAAWEPFEQDVGLGFRELSMQEAAERFGAFPYWIYAYNAASTIANVLFSEPTRGVFRIVHAVIEGETQPSEMIRLGSSVALTGLIGWWGVRCLKSTTRGQWSPESRLFVVMVVVLLATGALSFNYSRDRLAGLAVLFYAMASFFAIRAAAMRMLTASRARFVVAGVALALLAAAWQTRAVGTLERTRNVSRQNQEEWFVILPARRVEFAERPVYLRIMESMVEQGTDPAIPRNTRFPDWVFLIMGEP